MEKYKATFEIKHGVYGGFSKSNETITLDKEFIAGDARRALLSAYNHAEHLSNEYISGINGETTATITLYDPEGNEVDQVELLRSFNRLDEVNDQKAEHTISESCPEGRIVVSTLVNKLLAEA